MIVFFLWCGFVALLSALSNALIRPSSAAVRAASTPVMDNGRIVQRVAVFIDGSAVAFDGPLQMRQGQIYVPLRALSEALRATVSYDSQIGLITIERREHVVVVDAPAHNAPALVPLCSTSETLGATVSVENRDDIVVIELLLQDVSCGP